MRAARRGPAGALTRPRRTAAGARRPSTSTSCWSDWPGFTAQAPAEGRSVQVEPGLVLSADPIRLRQAVSNLVVNALQHTPAGDASSGASAPARRSRPRPGSGRVGANAWTSPRNGLAIVEAIVRGHGGGSVDAAGAGAGHDGATRPRGSRRRRGESPAVGQPTYHPGWCAVAVVRRGVSIKRTPSFAVSVVRRDVMTFVQSAAADPSVFTTGCWYPTRPTEPPSWTETPDSVKAFARSAGPCTSAELHQTASPRTHGRPATASSRSTSPAAGR